MPPKKHKTLEEEEKLKEKKREKMREYMKAYRKKKKMSWRHK